MGEFDDSPKWKLVNDFTIHEDQNLSDRPFMRTCVPKTLEIDVSSFEVVNQVLWPSSFGEKDEDRASAFEDRTYVRFEGTINDRITVFRMEKGEIATFRAVTDAKIRPLPKGQIGGKHKATVYDGIGYSGMTSRDVPEGGLMEGEPGGLSYLAEFEERDGGPKTPASLTATLFLDEDKFKKLVVGLSLSPRPVTEFKLYILAELFESEVSASLSESWMAHDYGLLNKGSVVSTAAARIESLSWSTGVNVLTEPESEDSSPIDRLLGIERPEASRESQAATLDRAALRYQRYIFLALVGLILVTLLTGS